MTQTFTEAHPLDATHQAAAFPLGCIARVTSPWARAASLRDWEIITTRAKGKIHSTQHFLRYPPAEPRPAAHPAGAGRRASAPVHTVHGYHPSQNGGPAALPEFPAARGEYPIAWIDLDDPALQVSVQLEAFTPLIPAQPGTIRAIPCGLADLHGAERVGSAGDADACRLALQPGGRRAVRPFKNIAQSKRGKTKNEYRDEAQLRGHVHVLGRNPRRRLSYGNMTLATTHPNVTVKPSWLRKRLVGFSAGFLGRPADGDLTDQAMAIRRRMAARTLARSRARRTRARRGA